MHWPRVARCLGNWAWLGSMVCFARSHQVELQLSELPGCAQLDPLYRSPKGDKADPATWVSYLVHAPLAIAPGPDVLEPWLLREIPSPEAGTVEMLQHHPRSRVRVRLRLRPDARWGDGSQIEAQDLLATWRAARMAWASSDPSHFFTRAHHATLVAGELGAVDFFFPDKHFALVGLQRAFLMPARFARREQVSGRFTTDARVRAYCAHPNESAHYSGPYRPVWSSAELGFEPNYSFWPGVAHIDRVVIRPIRPAPGYVVRPCGVGALHRICGTGANLSDQLQLPTLWLEAVWLNLRNPAFYSRQQRAQLQRRLSQLNMRRGNRFPAEVACGFLSADHLRFGEFLRERDRAPARDERVALSLPPRLQVWVSPSRRHHPVVDHLREQLGADSVQWAVSESRFLAKLQRMEFPDTALASLYLPAESSFERVWSSSSIPRLENGYEGENISGFGEELFDTLVRRHAEGWHLARRADLAAQLAREIDRLSLMVPLFFHAETVQIQGSLELPCAEWSLTSVAACAHRWRVSGGRPAHADSG